MTPEEFRRYGREAVDWIADYMERIESFPVCSGIEPGGIRALLPPDPPEHGESFDRMLADLEEKILPGITHWQSPNFFAFFPANVSGPSILGELLSAGFGVQGMLWITSPACTELETHVLDWVAGMLDLPEKFLSTGAGGGVIQDSASSATLCALIAARERALNRRDDGPSGDSDVPDPGRLTAYASTQAHSSVEKAVRIAGLRTEQLRLVEIDDNFAMRPDALAGRMEADASAGLQPFFVCATAGTTSSLAFDPLDSIGRICREKRAWMHVDAAMAGTAAVCPELRSFHDGVEHADSYCFNPHKWMFTNFDCDCFYVADRTALISALSVLPEYLRNRPTEAGGVIDYRDWQVPLGRRFRALKLWFVIRWYGVDGIRRHVREHVDLARDFARRVELSKKLEPAAPPSLNLVCFRHRSGAEASRRLLEKLNGTGRLYLTHTTLDDRFTLRFCVGQANTKQRHVDRAWELISEEASLL